MKRKPNKWINFVINFSFNDKITFKEALKSPICRDLYYKIFKNENVS
jgi:hypothetical protein